MTQPRHRAPRPQWVQPGVREQLPDYNAFADRHCTVARSGWFRDHCERMQACETADEEVRKAHMGALVEAHTAPTIRKADPLFAELTRSRPPPSATSPLTRRPWCFGDDDSGDVSTKLGDVTLPAAVQLSSWATVQDTCADAWRHVGVGVTVDRPPPEMRCDEVGELLARRRERAAAVELSWRRRRDELVAKRDGRPKGRGVKAEVPRFRRKPPLPSPSPVAPAADSGGEVPAGDGPAGDGPTGGSPRRSLPALQGSTMVEPQPSRSFVSGSTSPPSGPTPRPLTGFGSTTVASTPYCDADVEVYDDPGFV